MLIANKLCQFPLSFNLIVLFYIIFVVGLRAEIKIIIVDDYCNIWDIITQ